MDLKWIGNMRMYVYIITHVGLAPFTFIDCIFVNFEDISENEIRIAWYVNLLSE